MVEAQTQDDQGAVEGVGDIRPGADEVAARAQAAPGTKPAAVDAEADLNRRVHDVVRTHTKKSIDTTVATLEHPFKTKGIWASIGTVVGATAGTLLTAAYFNANPVVKNVPSPPEIVTERVPVLLPSYNLQSDVLLSHFEKKDDPELQIFTGPIEWIEQNKRIGTERWLNHIADVARKPIAHLPNFDANKQKFGGSNQWITTQGQQGSLKRFGMLEGVFNTPVKAAAATAAFYDVNGVVDDMNSAEAQKDGKTDYLFSYFTAVSAREAKPAANDQPAVEARAASPAKITVTRDVGQDGKIDSTNPRDGQLVITIEIK